MKKLAIINERLFRKARSAERSFILGALRGGLGADIVFTGYEGHGKKIAREAGKYDALIAVGGDGTIFDILNAMDHARQLLATVPLGTGNGLSRDRSIVSPIRAVERIRQGRVTTADLIECRYRTGDEWRACLALSTIGCGHVADTVAIARKYCNGLGRCRYPLATLVAAFRQKTVSAAVSVDDAAAETLSFTILLVNNTRHAGNFCVFPEAAIDDGVFDMTIGRLGAVKQIVCNIGILTRTYVVPYPGGIRQARSLRAVPERPVPLMVDGEMMGPVRELRCAVSAGKVRLLG